jgi:demethylmenaquinone methyltransferase/2-methoxy-6-polyprenyl-1,4-benzoquinol methylase
VSSTRPARASLDSALATPDGKARYVRGLFHTISDRYDLITILLSFGRDRAWKRRLVRLAELTPATRVLDLACGTGDITFEAGRSGARVVGLDITERMVRLAREKGDSHPFRGSRTEKGDCPPFLVGDMMALPFPDAAFDVATAGYGIRNVPELRTALREVARVLRPGGVFLSLDFNRPDSAPIRAVYLGYLEVVGGALGWALHGEPDTYRYIPATIRRYPGATRVAAMMRDNGFDSAEWLPVLGGLMAIHRARRS